MKNFFSKIFFTMMLAFAASAFVACDKNNDDDESQNQESTPEEVGVEINGITWATRNVDAPGTFAENPEDAGMFYQWNRKIGWSGTDPLVNSDGGTEWDNTTPEGEEWEKVNDPCPSGWRVPTTTEQRSLIDAGSTWTTQNGVTGRIFGSGSNTVFLPAAGGVSDGALFDIGTYGVYWSSTQFDSNYPYYLFFDSDYADPYDHFRRMGFSVRCVADDTPPIYCTVSVSANPAEGGTVTQDGTGTYLPGTSCTVTATANSGYTFVKWTENGSVVSTDSNYQFTVITRNRSLVAKFTQSSTGTVIDGIVWATRNVDAPGTFADTPESPGMLYQWNRRIGWSSTDPMVNSNGGTTWDSSTPDGTEWEPANDPCPSGWRVPTHNEQVSLLNSGSSWTTQNGVTGSIYGSGSNTVFLPAAGYRDDTGGTLLGFGSYGYYWSSSTQFDSNYANRLFFRSVDENTYGASNRLGFSVRCVQ